MTKKEKDKKKSKKLFRLNKPTKYTLIVLGIVIVIGIIAMTISCQFLSAETQTPTAETTKGNFKLSCPPKVEREGDTSTYNINLSVDYSELKTNFPEWVPINIKVVAKVGENHSDSFEDIIYEDALLEGFGNGSIEERAEDPPTSIGGKIEIDNKFRGTKYYQRVEIRLDAAKEGEGQFPEVVINKFVSNGCWFKINNDGSVWFPEGNEETDPSLEPETEPTEGGTCIDMCPIHLRNGGEGGLRGWWQGTITDALERAVCYVYCETMHLFGYLLYWSLKIFENSLGIPGTLSTGTHN